MGECTCLRELDQEAIFMKFGLRKPSIKAWRDKWDS